MKCLESVSLSEVCRGEPKAWNRFVQTAGPLLRGVVWRLLSSAGRAGDCPDVLQEVFLRLVRDDFSLLRRYDPRRATLGTWLGVVATSAAIDWLRKAQPALEPLDGIPADRLPSVHDTTASGTLDIPTELLSPRQILILKLLYVDDLDVSEVARLLRITAQTVRSQRHKAFDRLRNRAVRQEKESS